LPDISDILANCKELMDAGHPSTAIVQYLHDHHVKMLDAMRTVRTLYAVGLAEADFMILSHPAWKEEAIISARLTDAFFRLLNASRVRMLTDRFRAEGIGVGDVGSLIDNPSDETYEIEFSDTLGTPYAQILAHADEFEEYTILKEPIFVLLDQVPREPNTQLPEGATDQELFAFEKSMVLRLPVELKEWLRTCNGPCVGPGGIYGVSPAPDFLSIEAHLASVPDWKTRGWFPVAGDGCGNHYVLDSNSGSGDQHPIYFIDHELSLTEPQYIVASNLWQFLRFLLQAELDRLHGIPPSWPFHEATVRAADPGLAQYSGKVSFPWETR
jgi:hypothetical protein